MIPRKYSDLDSYLKPGKVLMILGPRQVGKTTTLESFLSATHYRSKLVSGDDIRVQQILGSQNSTLLQEYVAGYDLLAIDEAQRIPNVGIGLKIIVDHVKTIHGIATGSSSFALTGQMGEPLTGRKRTLTMNPVAQMELRSTMSAFEMKEQLKDVLVFGSYPAVLTSEDRKEKISILEELTHSYLLKDILELERVRSSKVLLDLLRLLAFQTGSEVSHAELATKLGIDGKTVARYIDLLEKAFVLYNLRGFSRNLRKEVVKKSKYFFFDNGVRNAVISNFNPMNLRNDDGQLWENFLVSERLKMQQYSELRANNFFWRTWDKKEIDWVEEREGRLFGYEFKYTRGKARIPQEFLDTYPESTVEIINRENYQPFVGITG